MQNQPVQTMEVLEWCLCFASTSSHSAGLNYGYGEYGYGEENNENTN